MTSYSLIGLMSGTSMDGVDLAFCQFTHDKEQWKYDLRATATYPYPMEISEVLKRTKTLTAVQIYRLDKQLGFFYADCVLRFMKDENIDPADLDALASHGHTIFHQPEHGFTLQIGCGSAISSRSGLPVINDFRQKDVLAGGQGAPLVPIGDALLLGDSARAFLNIGGFCNVCYLDPHIVAYDVCPGNLPLNQLAEELGLSYDKNGNLAANGSIDNTLLQSLNALPYYQMTGPKSLGTEWLDTHFTPILRGALDVQTKLTTVTEHIAIQLAKDLEKNRAREVLVTGGGARNSYLMRRINHHFSGNILPGDEQLIDFKEALIFAFLGALYLADRSNCLSAVTGAKKDVKGGVLHLP